MYDPNRIYQALLEAGNDWADKRAAFCLLDDVTKSIEADCYARANGASATEKKELAKIDSMYTDHLKSLSEARRAMLLAQVKYDSMKALADAKKTEEITRMSERKHLDMAT